MKSTCIFLMGMLLFATSCTKTTYLIQGQIEDDMQNGNNVYLYDYNRDMYVDTAKVINSAFSFKGKVMEPSVCRVSIEETDIFSDIILEKGEIHIFIPSSMEDEDYTNRIVVSGTPLNDSLEVMKSQIDKYIWNCKMYRAKNDRDTLSSQKIKKERYQNYKDQVRQGLRDVMDASFKINSDNPYGAYIFVYGNKHGIYTEADYNTFYPNLNERFQKCHPIEQITNRHLALQRTAKGMYFSDFTIEEGSIDGRDVSLSDYVSGEKYLLVEFWASWCIYCNAGLPILKDVYKQYSKKLTLLSVAVWDDREKSLLSIRETGRNWNQIINTGMIPSDLYGVNGIPFLMLISPDGIIVERGIQKSQLKSVLAKYLQ